MEFVEIIKKRIVELEEIKKNNPSDWTQIAESTLNENWQLLQMANVDGVLQ